ncbi:MAG TPA: AraC family transcriptional regulator [Chitinophaga sp.]|uniref:helix-turn-helix transcriptional regulator n=1 Tax=Chitinophaga sp. TaxID=1869181 RepID=UPI002C37D2ED|nr:AraC family transcriptional regulator [Chitinophaga sp.]HVI48834.1 AraC family transcriptional regulator [Chitinophaga sp.]
MKNGASPSSKYYLARMLHRFPPAPGSTDASFLTGKTEVFAKLKIESLPGKRTVLMTAHTLIFVTKGVKLLHFPGETVKVSPGEVILLRKGIYVMAEYIGDGLDFEAMMLFLPGKLLQAMAKHCHEGSAHQQDHYLVFPATSVVNGFKESFRKYFDSLPSNFEWLLPLKQQEILLLLLSGSGSGKVQSFIKSAISAEPADIDFIVNNYLLQPVTIEELAGLCNCSLAKFKRDFRQRYRSSPRVWINTRRLAHAHMLLLNTSKQVTEIALECGFENTSYFIRLFRNEYGHPPAALRAGITIK